MAINHWRWVRLQILGQEGGEFLLQVARLEPARAGADMCIQLLQQPPASDAQLHTTTNIHQPTFGRYLVCPALWFTAYVEHIWRSKNIFSCCKKKVTRKRVGCGNFWGVWSPAPPPTVRHTLGSATNGLMGGDTEIS